MRDCGDGAFEARAGADVIAKAAPGNVSIDPPALLDENAIAAARESYLRDDGKSSQLPYCFVCGVRRRPGDGMRIFAGAAPNSSVNADKWTPSADLADKAGLVRPEYLWAALDCPTAFALRHPALCLLGRLTVKIERRPAPAEDLTVMAWAEGNDGRKRYSSSALFDKAGEIIAAANAVWIEIADDALLERIKAENA